MIKLGGFFERALLFKALSDYFQLSSTLAISLDRRVAWNDVKIPVKNLLIKIPNFTIDLMENPGEMYPVRSEKSNKYKFWK